ARTQEPRDLADAPKAFEHDHVDEPAKSLLKLCPKRLDQVFHGQALGRLFPSEPTFRPRIRFKCRTALQCPRIAEASQPADFRRRVATSLTYSALRSCCRIAAVSAA